MRRNNSEKPLNGQIAQILTVCSRFKFSRLAPERTARHFLKMFPQAEASRRELVKCFRPSIETATTLVLFPQAVF